MIFSTLLLLSRWSSHTVHEIDSYIRVPPRYRLYDLTLGIEYAVVKCHRGRAVCPDTIVTGRAIKGSVLECCRSIAPVEGLAVDRAIFNDGIVCTDKAEIICRTGLKRHISKSDCSCAIKAVITVVFGAEVGGVGNFRTDIPASLISALPNKCQVFAFCGAIAGYSIQCIIPSPSWMVHRLRQGTASSRVSYPFHLPSHRIAATHCRHYGITLSKRHITNLFIFSLLKNNFRF